MRIKAILNFLERFFTNLIERYQLNVIFKLFLYLLLIWFIGSTWLYFTENGYVLTEAEKARGEFNYFDSYLGSFRNNLIYIFSGFEEYVPHTTAGWFGSIFVMLFGSLGILALLIGNVTSIIQENVKRAHLIRPLPKYSKFENHIIICNWNKKGYELINQLHDAVISKHKPIIIISDNGDTIPKTNLTFSTSKFKNVWAIRGDPTNSEILSKAGVYKAETAIILSDEFSIDKYSPFSISGIASESKENTEKIQRKLVDSKTILIALVIESINKNVHTIVELKDKNNRIHFDRTNIDEIILAEAFSSKLIAQTVITYGLSELYSHLLTASGDSNEIYINRIQKRLIGKTYSEVKKIIYDKVKDTIVIGFITENAKSNDQKLYNRAGEVIYRKIVVLNPKNSKVSKNPFNKEYPLKESDCLITIAYEKPTDSNFFSD